MDSDTRRPHQRSPVNLADAENPPRVELKPKIGELLRQGNALLRAGCYQQAIHVWTRILFLERDSSVARDAIDKAKRALAEQQRELDVMVLNASRYLQDGNRQQAKSLLHLALSIDPRHIEGCSLREKLESLDRRGETPNRSLNGDLDAEASPRQRRKARVNPVKPRQTQPASPLKMAAFLFCAFCLFAIGGLYLHLNWDLVISDSAFASSRQAGLQALGERDAPLLPNMSELHYFNGVRLYEKGRYREALYELGRVERQSGVFEEARNLGLRIEARLLRDAIKPEVPPTDPK